MKNDYKKNDNWLSKNLEKKTNFENIEDIMIFSEKYIKKDIQDWM